MELQLGLSLASNPIKEGLDLNKYEKDPKDDQALTTHSCFCFGKNIAQKRSFDDDDDALTMAQVTLPLLSWNDKPNEDDDGHRDRKSLQNNSFSTIHESNGEEDGIVVGWPPIKRSRRILHLHHHHRQAFQNDRRNEVGSGGPNSMYVKVRMEGVPIGRKVDLSLHRSYQTLTNTLISMFGKYSDEGDMRWGSNEGTRRYTLAYQDRDGDWLLVGDTTPWQNFVRSVRRLEILIRTGGS